MPSTLGWCASSAIRPTEASEASDNGAPMAVKQVSTKPGHQEIEGHILIATAGLSGLLYSSVEIGRRLAGAGHRVTYAGPDAVRNLVEHHDLDFAEIEPSRYDEFLAKDAGSSRHHRLRHLRRRRSEAIESLRLESFVATVRDLDPDLLLLDGEMHEQILSVAGLGVPIALLNTFPSIWRQPGLPPTHVMVRPGVGWQGGRPSIAAHWFALRLRKWRTRLVQRLQRVGCDRVSVLRHLAEETGFEFRRQTDRGQWLIPFSYRDLPYLSLHALEFEFPHQPPETVHYVGPMVLDDRLDVARNENERAKIEAVLERRQRAGTETRLIYAGFGSVFSTDLDFVRRLGYVIAERPGWELILSLSDRVKPESLGSLPERVHVFSWVPQIEVLKHVDAVVTHGGINTLDECVLSGVPVLVYCGGETDMAGNTARVVHHGIGLTGDREQDSTADICRRLGRLLDEPSFARNVSRLREQYEAYREGRVAERVVQSLLRQVSSLKIAPNPLGESP